MHNVWIGGNLGGSLLPRLDDIGEDDWVVLELSSFMLHHLRDQPGMPGYDQGHYRGWSPHIAVVTNLSANHLDWHGEFDAYVKAKQVIFEHQDPSLAAADAAVLGPGASVLFKPVAGYTRVWHEPEMQRVIDKADGLAVPGRHNRVNALLAGWVIHEINSRVDTLALLADFPGLPHRLQYVAEHNGVRFFNDSKSTTPEAATLAIDAFDAGTTPGCVHIILGGSDKGSDLAALAEHAAEKCAGVYTIGATGDTIAGAAETACDSSQNERPETCGGVAWPPPSADVVRCGDLDTAVERAVTNAKPGQVVLLSPGCASWDQFDHFEQRGNRFVEQVLRCTTETGA